MTATLPPARSEVRRHIEGMAHGSVWLGVFDALSARVAAPHADALWVSSHGVSTALLAVPDASIVTPDQMAAVAQRIGVAAPQRPIFVDCDQGYGDPDVLAHFVRGYAQSTHVSGICIEDKEFPKRNSFYAARQRLMPVADMQTMVARARDARQGLARPAVIARTEALVAGATEDDVIRRLDAYVEAGADAVFIQARTEQEQPFLAAGGRWAASRTVPLLCAPTGFPGRSHGEIFAAGFDVVIRAHVLIRATVAALQRAVRTGDVIGDLASMTDIEALVAADLLPDLVTPEEVGPLVTST